MCYSTSGVAVPSVAASLAVALKNTDSEHFSKCPLPHGGRWCRFSLTNGASFPIACYKGGVDFVCNRICRTGSWDIQGPQDFIVTKNERRVLSSQGFGRFASLMAPNPFNSTRVFLDIGAHVGTYSLVFAAYGWKSIAVEPFADNFKLLNATLCRNPSLARRVHILPVALQSIEPTIGEDFCNVVSSHDNYGTSRLCCGKDWCGINDGEARFTRFTPRETMVSRGVVKLQTLNTALRKVVPQWVDHVDVVKMDVDGYECEVFRGGGM